ncbi:MAG: hydrolase [Tepidisphaeraceae bacterium]|jgi:glutamate carboxypeptidase
MADAPRSKDDGPESPKVCSLPLILAWIATQRPKMLRRVIDWSNVNSYSYNVAGLEKLGQIVEREFSVLGGVIQWHDLSPAVLIDGRAQPISKPLGRAMTITKRPGAKLRILLNIHLDTVYPPDSPFQSAGEEAGNVRGPGVADAKGGLAVMLTALEALERSGTAEGIGWQVLINPDEEIGSPGSGGLLAAAAKEHHFGLLFEPALPDGALVDRRRGSGNFSIVIRGRAAHAGRDFAAGRSAILAAAKISLQLDSLNRTLPGVTVNVGAIDGGAPPNVVPDLAICRINIRTTQLADEQIVANAVKNLVSELNSAEGIRAELHGQFSSPAKIPDDRTLRLLDAIVSCGKELGMTVATRSSGGASDGNRLAAAGLPNIDSLGVRGDLIHTPNEYMIPDSLVERAQLAALLMLKIAAGDIDPIPFCR